MPSRRNRNVRPQSVPEHDRITYTPTAPLIQLDSSPLSSDLEIECNLHPDQPFARGEGVDDGLVVKHEGGSISPTPILAALPSSSHPEASAQGHMRSPVLAREPTMLEAFSRAVRDYVPSSVSIPTAAPSPPRVSKPVSFGSFDVHPGFSRAAPEERHTQVPHHRRRLSGASGTHHPSGSTRVYSGHPLESDTLLGSEEDGDTGASSKPTSPSTVYPTVGEGDPVSTSQQNTNNNQVRNVLLSNIDTPSHHRDVDLPIRAETREEEAEASDFVPVYALSHRLLAFTSQPPRLDACHKHPHGTPSHPRAQDSRTHDRSSSFPSSSSTLPFGIAQISQVDLGNTAFKVGGTVLSGMKSLGGMALSAATGYARSRVGSRSETRPHQPLLPSSAAGGAVKAGTKGYPKITPLFMVEAPTSGGHLNVINPPTLKSLTFLHSSSVPNPNFHIPVAEFVAAKQHGIRHLAFTRDGNSVAVTLTGGQVVKMFQLRPLPKTGGCGSHGAGVDVKGTERGECSTDPSSLTAGDSAPWHIYNLRRGHTPSVIEGIDISPDGRWAAIGSGNRTVHVFSINPYGGKPDRRSHVDARIWNVDRPPLSIELLPVARLRFPRPDPAFGSVPQGPLSFIFLPGDIHMPGSLLPLPPPPVVASSPSTSSARSDLGHFPSSSRPRNYKDILVFDPPSGILSLRRITMEERPKEPSISSPITSFATSISFPGTGYANRLGNSPPAQSSKEGRKTSGLTQQLLDVSVELDWGEVKQLMSEMSKQRRVEVSDSLAHAELSTSSRHPEIVPRSVYLSHQFLFYTLGEDYHALIRRLCFGIKGDKVAVRRTVRGANELFVTGTHGGLDHRAASSFDEPLANAIASGLDGPFGVPSIPMFPNGTAGRPRPFGRLRREMHRVRSPKEHDGRRHLGVDPEGASEGSGISGVTGVSLPTPSTHTDLLDVEGKDSVGGAVDGEFGGEDDGRGWDWAEEDKRAIDEAEQVRRCPWIHGRRPDASPQDSRVVVAALSRSVYVMDERGKGARYAGVQAESVCMTACA
ncbi:hypothetical protein EDD15DRAFT_2374145 [Pisolithus albus]|nr:hypothetical protein EDD15DRAFT_2374145 [Pisolithus albus]